MFFGDGVVVKAGELFVILLNGDIINADGVPTATYSLFRLYNIEENIATIEMREFDSKAGYTEMLIYVDGYKISIEYDKGDNPLSELRKGILAALALGSWV